MNKEIKIENEHKLSNLKSIFYNLRLVESSPQLQGEQEIEEFNRSETAKVEHELLEISNILDHAEAGLKSVYKLNLDIRKEIYSDLFEEIKEIKLLLKDNNVSFYELRMKYIQIVEEMINSIFISESTSNPPSVKLRINASNVVIYDLFRQPKNLSVQGSSKILSQSNKEIAEFIVRNIEGFEKVKIETVEKEISRDQIIKKDSLLINLKN